MPQLIIIAGANGSGKTTFAIPFTKDRGYEFLNADELTKFYEEQGEENALIKAGRTFFQKLNDNLKQGKDFVVETTLSGSYINKVARRARKDGYKVTVIYIFVDNPKICINRVNKRVLKGGHNVDNEDIIRRYYRSKQNFWKNFTILSNDWFLIYNGDEGFKDVAFSREKAFVVLDEILFELFNSNKNERS